MSVYGKINEFSVSYGQNVPLCLKNTSYQIKYPAIFATWEEKVVTNQSLEQKVNNVAYCLSTLARRNKEAAYNIMNLNDFAAENMKFVKDFYFILPEISSKCGNAYFCKK